MRIGVIGINHKLADLKLRENFAKICQQRFTPGNFVHGPHNLVVLSTCNRTEVYFCSEDLTGTHSYLINILRHDLNDISETFDQKLYSYFGHSCFMHLARVTAGLDSAIVAETEIQGQVKSAYEKTMEYASLPSEMHFLFQKSLKIGKLIRTELPLGRGIPDIEHAILSASFHMFGEPEKKDVLIVGASDINKKILAFLKAKQFQNLTLCNRTEERGNALSEKFGSSFLCWSKLDQWKTMIWWFSGRNLPSI